MSSANLSTDSGSLQSLSNQLLSLGLINRPLDLGAVFFPPSKQSSAEQAAAVRAREGLLRCVWAMVGGRAEIGEALERVEGMNRVREYELDRMTQQVSVEKRKSQQAEKEMNTEKAKAK